MCELLGLNFNRPVRPAISFRGFRHGGADNPHGWGIARFDGKACQVFKEPIKGNESKLATFIRDYELFESKTFISHVRFASHGTRGLQNTHPFVRTFRSREVALAHNGTLRMKRSDLTFHPVGQTDSELLLCTLLTTLSREHIEFSNYVRIEAVLREFNNDGNMNLLFSDGEHLFCYRDQRGYNNLFMVERRAPYSTISLKDEDWLIDLKEEKRLDQRGFVIATRKLTDEPWNEIKPGNLMVFKDGDCVYGIEEDSPLNDENVDDQGYVSLNFIKYRPAPSPSEVLIDAVHAAKPNSEMFTGEIVGNVSQKTGCNSIIATVSRNIADLNRSMDGTNQDAMGEYRNGILDFLRKSTLLDEKQKLTRPFLHIGVHGCNDQHPYDIEIGTCHGRSCSPEIEQWLKNTIEVWSKTLQTRINRKIRLGVNKVYYGDPSIAFHRNGDNSSHYQGFGENFNTVQIEFARWLRKDYRSEIIDVLSELVDDFSITFNNRS
ncbi:MAG: class II glutamine amidotransferase [SAR324 cluster bacterium]|nr:class II glutamine amidotransferase [SAR324 cluster bacterium]